MLAVVAVAVAAIVIAAARDDRDLAFTPGIPEFEVVANLDLGEEACRRAEPAAEEFAAARFLVGTYNRPGKPVRVTVRDPDTRRAIASGRVPAGFANGSRLTVPLRPAVPRGRPFAFCIENAGAQRLALFGAPPPTGAPTPSRVANEARGEVAVEYLRGGESSALAQVPEIFRRAALFRPGWVGSWTFWVLLALVLLAAPMLLARAVADALREDER